MADYDGLWKALPEVVTMALIHSLFPDVTAPLTPWKTEMAVISRREIDGSFLAKVDGEPVLLHLEYQNYLDATMPRRIHEYASLLEQQVADLPIVPDVIPIVIWAVPGNTPAPRYYRERWGKVLCQREYFELHLAAMDWQTVNPLLLVLAPYLHGVRREDLATIALRLYAAAPAAQQNVLLGAFLALSERKYADFGEIEQAILQQVRQQMNEIMQALEESSFGVAIFQKGEAQERIKMLRTLWALKFGGVTEDVEATLASASAEVLEQLIAQMVNPTFSLTQARAQLGL